MRPLGLRSVLAAFLLTFTISPGGAVTAVAPAAFVQDLADKVLAIFNNPELARGEKEKRMYPIAVKAFDVPRTARFVLGRYWKDTPEAEREAFTKTFEHYMVHIYTGQFDQYHDVEFKTVYSRPEGETATLVRTRIIRHDGGPPITVDWWLRSSGETYKIIDVMVEGVSQLVALRDQFAAVITDHGGSVPALTEHLREKIAG